MLPCVIPTIHGYGERALMQKDLHKKKKNIQRFADIFISSLKMHTLQLLTQTCCICVFVKRRAQQNSASKKRKKRRQSRVE